MITMVTRDPDDRLMTGGITDVRNSAVVALVLYTLTDTYSYGIYITLLTIGVLPKKS